MLTESRTNTSAPRRSRIRATALIPAIVVGVLCTAGVAWSAITGNQVKNNSLTGLDIKDNSIKSSDLLNSGVTTGDIKNGTLTGADIADGALTSADIADGALTGADIQDGSLTGADIQDGSLTGADIQSGSLAGSDLANGTVAIEDLHANASADVIEEVNDNSVSVSTDPVSATLASFEVPAGTWLVMGQADFYNDSASDTQEVWCELVNGITTVASRDIYLTTEGEGMLFLSKVMTTSGASTTLTIKCTRSNASADNTNAFNGQLTALNTAGAQTFGQFDL